MSKEFKHPWWTVIVPDNWEGIQEKECATFQAEPRFGALQISAAKKSTAIQDSDLREFADKWPEELLSEVAYSEFTGIALEHEDDSLFWKEWWLRSGQTMLYVTYNVALRYKHLEMGTIEGILQQARAVEE